jgi:NAD(P)-dependent dehydrogenase (short-subunit alcohol dehydrogenase family)
MNQFSLSGKHVLITGASSGIGRQCAVSCSEAGATVTLVARNRDRLKETESQLKGCRYFSVAQDISELDAIEDVVKSTVEKNGKIDGFIHAAGIEGTEPITLLNAVKYKSYFDINVLAGLEFSRFLTKKKYCNTFYASFVFIASVMGTLGQPGKIAYSASKGALVNAVKSMALEFAGKNIRVNSISPGIVSTPMSEKLFASLDADSKQAIINMHPLGIGTVSDVANACVFLLSDAAKWITGTNLIIDGGYSAK